MIRIAAVIRSVSKCRSKLSLLALALALLTVPQVGDSRADQPQPLRAGIIGLDTSHVIAFTAALNDPEAEPPLAGIHVVAAFPGGSPDVEASHTRIEGFTAKLRQEGIVIVDSIPALLERVDVVLLESVDGRPHLEQARGVLEARKPLFIDKPVTASLADALEIFELAERHGTPCFSSSSLRFTPGAIDARDSDELGAILGCSVHSPCSLEPHHPDLFWYGIHGVEMLFTVMGTGCESVSRVQTEGTELVTGVWSGGRVGTFRGIREGKSDYGGLVYGSRAIRPLGPYPGYRPLLEAMAHFFRSGQPPVSAAETLEIVAFMEAADESKRQGGCPVSIESVFERARAEVAARRAGR